MAHQPSICRNAGGLASSTDPYYEEVLIARVHPEDPTKRSNSGKTPRHDKKVWHDRYRSIVDLEKHLYVNGIRIIKFFLHLSKEEQRKRFLASASTSRTRIRKFSLADIAERKIWKHYMKEYEQCLSATSTQSLALVCRSRRR